MDNVRRAQQAATPRPPDPPAPDPLEGLRAMGLDVPAAGEKELTPTERHRRAAAGPAAKAVGAADHALGGRLEYRPARPGFALGVDPAIPEGMLAVWIEQARAAEHGQAVRFAERHAHCGGELTSRMSTPTSPEPGYLHCAGCDTTETATGRHHVRIDWTGR